MTAWRDVPEEQRREVRAWIVRVADTPAGGAYWKQALDALLTLIDSASADAPAVDRSEGSSQ